MARKCSVKTNTSAASRHRRASSHFDKVFELHIFPVTYNKVTKVCLILIENIRHLHAKILFVIEISV